MSTGCPHARPGAGPLRLLALALLVPLAAAACTPSPATITLTLHDVRPITAAQGHYELWADEGQGPRSCGTFRVAADGGLQDRAGAPLGAFHAPMPASRIQTLAISQERPDDADELPSKQIFLRGPVAEGRAQLKPGLEPGAVANATGTFLLDDPVTVEDLTDWNGLWFATYMNRRYKPGLMLYDAPEGYLWAGWVILRGHALRTGKFRNGGDNDDWAGFSGRTGASPLIDPAGRPMPGEDFISKLPADLPTGRNQPDLAGAEVLVTLEDATLANEEVWPSPVIVFAGRVPTPSARLRQYPLENVAARRLPAADARLE